MSKPVGGGGFPESSVTCRLAGASQPLSTHAATPCILLPASWAGSTWCSPPHPQHKQEAATIPGRDKALRSVPSWCSGTRAVQGGAYVTCRKLAVWAIHSQMTLLLAPESPSCSTGGEAVSLHGAPARTRALSPRSPHAHSAETRLSGRIGVCTSAIMKTPRLAFLLIANMISNTSFS